MFTLTVYNMLSPDDLTRGLRIAGTGTISLDGTVGPIGGVQQKVAAAEQVGAVYFLCPADNYADASLGCAEHQGDQDRDSRTSYSISQEFAFHNDSFDDIYTHDLLPIGFFHQMVTIISITKEMNYAYRNQYQY